MEDVIVGHTQEQPTSNTLTYGTCTINGNDLDVEECSFLITN